MRIPSPKVTSIRSAVSAASKRDKSSESCRCVGVGRTCDDKLVYAVYFERQLNDVELQHFANLLMRMGDIANAGNLRSVQFVPGAEQEDAPVPAERNNFTFGGTCPTCSAVFDDSTVLAEHTERCGKPFCAIHGTSIDACDASCGNSPIDKEVPATTVWDDDGKESP